MDNVKIIYHKDICEKLTKTYEAKNADYGDSFSETRTKYPEAICIRLLDKLNRLEGLISGQDPKVDESIDDTLLDIANYAVMELVERRYDCTEGICKYLSKEDAPFDAHKTVVGSRLDYGLYD